MALKLALSLILNFSTNRQCDLGQDANWLSEPECPQCLLRIVLVYISPGDPEKRSFQSSGVWRTFKVSVILCPWKFIFSS